MSAVVVAYARGDLAQSDVGSAVAQRMGQPLRRAGMLSGMALLACLDVLEKECQAGAPSAACPTALLWHSTQGPQPETEALLAAQREGDGLLLPFEFLASQPSLLCAHLAPWVPGLEQSLFLPCTAHAHEQPWLQALHLADAWLAQGRYQRVICAALNRNGEHSHYAAISLANGLHPLAASPHAVHMHWRKTGARASPVVPQAQADNGLWHMLLNPQAGEAVLATPWAWLHLQRHRAAAPSLVGQDATP